MKYERSEQMNERIARIERVALGLGIALTSPTKSSREFALNAHRTIRFKPQGKGTMLIESRHSGVLDAQNVARDERIIQLLRKAADEHDGDTVSV